MLIAIVVASGPDGVSARSDNTICNAVARRVAAESGVPLSVLQAISLTETGRKRGGRLTSWPWTVNMEGEGHWFDSRDQALSFTYEEYRRGARSFDIGCFQINYKWHGRHFASIAEMFDPLANARYAARFLDRLYAETGDWSAAAGAYHSRTEKHARTYRKRFERHRAGLRNGPVAPPARVAAAIPATTNAYPLLREGSGARGLGSLVPLSTSATPLFDVRN